MLTATAAAQQAAVELLTDKVAPYTPDDPSLSP